MEADFKFIPELNAIEVRVRKSTLSRSVFAKMRTLYVISDGLKTRYDLYRNRYDDKVRSDEDFYEDFCNK